VSGFQASSLSCSVLQVISAVVHPNKTCHAFLTKHRSNPYMTSSVRLWCSFNVVWCIFFKFDVGGSYLHRKLSSTSDFQTHCQFSKLALHRIISRLHIPHYYEKSFRIVSHSMYFYLHYAISGLPENFKKFCWNFILLACTFCLWCLILLRFRCVWDYRRGLERWIAFVDHSKLQVITVLLLISTLFKPP
jgi:hypothetical protein